MKGWPRKPKEYPLTLWWGPGDEDGLRMWPELYRATRKEMIRERREKVIAKFLKPLPIIGVLAGIISATFTVLRFFYG